jgi:hypothetical protein
MLCACAFAAATVFTAFAGEFVAFFFGIESLPETCVSGVEHTAQD